ncbi:hypothetical protein [Algoriphagus boritolerans]|uniref:Uncharacterized protein n=1 Tax=Algoriphagus boritolerans DSM 17298 = JCM 18970 TaxID=1120964 RepID=A0A1H5ZKU9_9BACT|nr:hypothetical protein [Algoriphagus boritolerans]SEG36872.1 hypothetical protein SAMN03080598_03577 [Algoriphagus boritolerans DSM 17298 = JCM 18970]
MEIPRFVAKKILNQIGKPKVPAAFAKAYPDAKWNAVSKDNFLEWIC